MHNNHVFSFSPSVLSGLICRNFLFYTSLALAVCSLAFTACPQETDTRADHVHQWGKWTVTTEPSETEEGIETRVCVLNPEHKQTRSIPSIYAPGTPGLVFTLINGNEGSVSRGSATDEEVRIPAYCRNNNTGEYLPVTAISNNAFWAYSSLSSISIPASVTSIGNSAFYGCSSLSSISIPASVTSIGNSAFYGCVSLTDINIPEGITSIDYGTFFGCSSLTAITFPESITSIGNSAFHDCVNLADINIPETVTSVGYGSFFNTEWSVQQPDGLVYVSKVVYEYKGAMPDDTVINNIRPDTIGIATGAFFSYESLIGITIPEGVTYIGAAAFAHCSNLTAIPIPASVTFIGNGAFYGCYRLIGITLPEGITSINDYTFSDCVSLASINIPESVRTIGYGAFGYCTGLSSISIPEGIASIGGAVFEEWTSSQTINIEGHVSRTAADNAWGGKDWRSNCTAKINYLGS